MQIGSKRVSAAYATTLIAAAVLISVLAAMQSVATFGRKYVDPQRRAEVTSPAEGYQQLRSLGVRGRVLVLLDRTSHVDDFELGDSFAELHSNIASVPVTTSNLVSELIYADVAREVWIVVPPSEWARVEQILAARSTARREETGWSTRVHGVALHYTTTAPTTSEKLVVYEMGSVRELMDPTVVNKLEDAGTSDVVIVQKGG